MPSPDAPSIVWADEPTGTLDSESADDVMELMHEVHRDGLTLVLVTHDPEVGAEAERIIRMRDGAIVTDDAGDGAVHAGGRAVLRALLASSSIPPIVSARSMAPAPARDAQHPPAAGGAPLVIAGSLLGTAMITGSFIVGDTINRSIRAVLRPARPIDETCRFRSTRAPRCAQRLADFGGAHTVDGTLAFTTAPPRPWSPPGGKGGGTQRRAQLLEVDFPEGAHASAAIPTATGIKVVRHPPRATPR